LLLFFLFCIFISSPVCFAVRNVVQFAMKVVAEPFGRWKTLVSWTQLFQ